MRVRMWITVGILLINMIWGAGAWAASLEDVKKEMKETPVPGRTWLDMTPPQLVTGTTVVPLYELCVQGDMVRPADPARASMNFGKVRPGNQYPVIVELRYMSEVGDRVNRYYRMVELPACK